MRIFGPCRSSQHRRRRGRRAVRPRAPAQRAPMWSSRRAVREVQAHHVDAGVRSSAVEHRAGHRVAGPSGRDDLGPSPAVAWTGRRLGPSATRALFAASPPPAASCLRRTRGTRRRRSRCRRCRPRRRTSRSPPACRRRRRARTRWLRGDRLGDARRVPSPNCVELEHADRAVPDDGAGGLQHARRSARPLSRADVEDHVVAPHVVDRAHVGVRVGGELLGARPRRSGIGISAPRARASSMRLARDVEQVGLAQRLADVDAGGGEEGVGDAAADDQLVDLARAATSSTVSLVETLEPATIATSGRAGSCSAALERVELGRPAAGRRRRPARSCATPWVVASARCAVPKASITNTSHSAAMLRASSSSSFFSPLLKRTFSHSTALPGAHVDAVDPVLAQRHRPPSSSESRVATGASESFGSAVALLRAAQVRKDEHPGALVERVADGRQRGADARVAR